MKYNILGYLLINKNLINKNLKKKNLKCVYQYNNFINYYNEKMNDNKKLFTL